MLFNVSLAPRNSSANGDTDHIKTRYRSALAKAAAASVAGLETIKRSGRDSPVVERRESGRLVKSRFLGGIMPLIARKSGKSLFP